MINKERYIKNLLKNCSVSKDEIIQCLLANDKEINDDYLLCWNIREELDGDVLYILFATGDGKKLLPRIKKLAKENHCKKTLFVTQRPKAFERKYGFKVVGTLMEVC